MHFSVLTAIYALVAISSADASAIDTSLVKKAAYAVVGKADGFATGTTGGGSAVPAIPKDIEQLRSWLGDKTARVIVLDKEYNFVGSEGSKTVTGCRPASNTCGSKGQDAIPIGTWCDAYPAVKVTYDAAALSPIKVGPNKSLIGVGTKGVLRGTGLSIASASNIIIQNIHITDLNPSLIFGGDAIDLGGGVTKLWIDHVKFSNIGREMLVTHYSPNTGVTISNSDFDGNTKYSASCDGHHYWGILLNGVGNQITFARNYMHYTSGRSPKIVDTLFHAVNNYFEDNTGHAFDIEGGKAVVLAEANSFSNVKTPINTPTKDGKLTAIGNVLSNSGTFASVGSVSTAQFAASKVVKMAGSAVAASVKKNAGVGKI